MRVGWPLWFLIAPAVSHYTSYYIHMWLCALWFAGLVGGSSDNEGRIEVNFNGEWGTVCDDLWSIDDANVACRQLGFGTAVSIHYQAAFGQGSGTIWLDNLQCTGSEADLFSCLHNGPGSHNCGHSEDAGVVCSNIRKKLIYQM